MWDLDGIQARFQSGCIISIAFPLSQEPVAVANSQDMSCNSSLCRCELSLLPALQIGQSLVVPLACADPDDDVSSKPDMDDSSMSRRHKHGDLSVRSVSIYPF